MYPRFGNYIGGEESEEESQHGGVEAQQFDYDIESEVEAPAAHGQELMEIDGRKFNGFTFIAYD